MTKQPTITGLQRALANVTKERDGLRERAKHFEADTAIWCTALDETKKELAATKQERDSLLVRLALVLGGARSYLASTARDYATKERKGLEEAVREVEVGT